MMTMYLIVTNGTDFRTFMTDAVQLLQK